MNTLRFRVLLIALLASASTALAAPQAHMVFFTLAERNDANRDALVAACHKYLDDHKGTVYFSVGVMAEELKRSVNDREFDVALHMVFDSPESAETYQTHPRHLEFIKQANSLWSKVRVFDSNLKAAKAAEPSTK